MVLDGIDFERGKKGYERITRTMRKQVIIRRSIDFTISFSLNIASTYFTRTNQRSLQVITAIIPLISNSFFTYFCNAYILHTRGKVLISVLQHIVTNNKKLIVMKVIVASDETNRLQELLIRFRYLIPIRNYIILTGLSLLSLAVYGFLTLESSQGLSYASLCLASLLILLMLPTFLIVNKFLGT